MNNAPRNKIGRYPIKYPSKHPITESFGFLEYLVKSDTIVTPTAKFPTTAATPTVNGIAVSTGPEDTISENAPVLT